MIKMKKNTLLLFVFLLAQMVFAQGTLTKAITKFTSDKDLSTAGISLCVLDVQTGNVVASHNQDRSLSPASSMKVVTTGAALGILSPDYVFKTEIQYDGSLNTQTTVLDGNVYIKGFGDPTLGSSEMEGIANYNTIMDIFAEAVDKADICKINGRIVGDGTYFQGLDAIGITWQWDDIGNYYGAGAYGLNLNENYYHLNIQQVGQMGASPKILSTTPYIPDMTFENKLSSAAAGTGDNSLIFTAPYSDESIVRGSIPVGTGTFRVKGSMPNPMLASAYLLHQRLKDNYKCTIRKTPADFEEVKLPVLPRKTIYTHYSPKLSAIAARTNLESVNIYAEALVRAVGQVSSNKGIPSAGIDAIENYWKNKGVDLNGFFMEDGSGLSPKNAVTARQLANILRVAAADNAIFPSLYESLPKAGETGTLKNMFKGTKAIGRLRAKSGSMTRVRSYSGYVTRANGKMWSFSVIVNNYNCSGSEMRAKLQELMVAMCD
jgi:serine-type D-Ala-D-Ala carboxypeptidase/endopeptidase (penicillin-binding protein 4)